MGFFGAKPDAEPDFNPPLAGKPYELISLLGGPLGDIAHDQQALARATALANGPEAATFGYLLLDVKGCLGRFWKQVYAVIVKGAVYIFESPTAERTLRLLAASDCECEVGEREECKAGVYCFRLKHADGSAAFCAFNSKAMLLWLQALQTGGVKYEDPPVDVGNTQSLFELRATLLTGEEIHLDRYQGCVCLVVNAASK
jgi:hypothetical protein